MDRTLRQSRTRITRPVLLGGMIATGLSMAFGTPSPASAAPVAGISQQAASKDQAKLVDDFLHYVLIAKPDLAEASAQSLFDSGITDEELAELVSEQDLGEKAQRAFRRGRGMAGVGPLVTDFERRLENGRLALARNQDRVIEAIGMLNGTMRAKMLATRRLVEAGEYAVPELLNVIVKGDRPDLEIEATKILTEIKRQAVLPLCAALPNLSPTVQVKVCRILADIGWPTAIPFLLETMQDSRATKDVKDAAMRAFRRLGGTSTDASAAFAVLSRKFFDEEQSLIAYPSDPANIVWSYGPHSGLVPTMVPTNIFAQVMAMQTARRALEYQSSNATALALYVASDLRRENQLRPDQTDPFAADARYTPQFFATATGASTARAVLAMAIDSSDTALVRDAIRALGETAGRSSLFRSGGREPLLECLRYPDRRVQYDAALVLGSALPSSGFPGDDQVVPLLASAVRSGDSSYAAVISASEENRNQIGSMLRNDGFTLLNGGSTFYEFEPEVLRASGVDLIVVEASPDEARETLSQIRNFARTSATPVIVVASSLDKIGLEREFASDRATGIWLSNAGTDGFKAVTDNLMMRASGGRLSQADALGYTRDSLDTLLAIAIDQGSVYRIVDAEPSLLEALGTLSGRMRIMVAEVLAMMPTQKSQRALIDAALSAQGNDQIDLFDQAAHSARRFGNYADDRQVKALGKLIEASTGSGNSRVADAAGRLYGSLNLSASDAVRLITD